MQFEDFSGTSPTLQGLFKTVKSLDGTGTAKKKKSVRLVNKNTYLTPFTKSPWAINCMIG